MSEEKMTLQAAVAYLQPIADSAVVGHYGEALDMVLTAVRAGDARERSWVGPARIVEMPRSPETNTRYWEVYCETCRTHECMFEKGDPRLTERRDEHNRAHAERPLAALSTQPAAVDCEGTCDYYGGVCVTCGRAQPTELAELFPGTLAALDHLSIRPEVQ